MQNHIAVAIAILLSTAPASGQSTYSVETDTLLNVVQWPASAGGNDHWYGIISLVKPWVDQRDLAGSLIQAGDTGYLATITSQAENDFVMSVVQNHTNQPSVADEFYIGGIRTGIDFQWLTGEPMLYTNWASGEPSGDGPALAIWGASQGGRAGLWNDVPEDTAGVGSIHQLWSLIEWGEPDSGKVDTLLNVVQWPVSAGGNDHWYGIISLVQPWVDQRDLAGSFTQAGDTGYLATITSPSENDFVMSVIENHTDQPSVADEFFIGGAKIGGVWQWLIDEPMAYTKWSSGEPSGDGNALAIWGASQGARAGFWNDVPEDIKSGDTRSQLWSVIEFGPPDSGIVVFDSLLNLVQWPLSAGGNDHWYGILPLVVPWVFHRDIVSSIIHSGDTGYLATITSQAENDFIMSVVQDHTNQPSVADEFFIGGTKIGSDWQWLIDEPMIYTNWAIGEPSRDGNALAIWGASQGARAGQWNDVPENISPDDTRSQLWSLVEFGPLDSGEVIIDTLLNVIQWPISADGNDHWYGIISLVKPWVEHRNLVRSFTMGTDTGYLATIHSVAENDFIMSVIENHTNQPSVADEFWIGGMLTSFGWQWLTGEPMVYTNWASREPSGDGRALAIWGASQGNKAGQWNDAPEGTIGGSSNQLWSVIEWGVKIPCGDVDGDGEVTWVDVDFLVSYYFLFGPPPDPVGLGDVNRNGVIDLGDIVLLSNFLNGLSDSPCSGPPIGGGNNKFPDNSARH